MCENPTVGGDGMPYGYNNKSAAANSSTWHRPNELNRIHFPKNLIRHENCFIYRFKKRIYIYLLFR